MKKKKGKYNLMLIPFLRKQIPMANCLIFEILAKITSSHRSVLSCSVVCLKSPMCTTDWPAQLHHRSTKILTLRKAFCCNYLVARKRSTFLLAGKISAQSYIYCFAVIPARLNHNYCSTFTTWFRAHSTHPAVVHRLLV